ncbi:MAG: hypothetical protein A3E81_02230 [Gammaproteobacteria bacterium RIFCSPHIGHO2_12_FULL_36_30]|nr:MAG: hypothetical protein A3E81_02230 [Gammaproteobacteria bacterium RIFCSPHIGHO2_12_FULL_36_30]
MNISKETLLAESNRAGFRAEILEKVIRLIDLLNAFSNDIFLKSRIALKGGTALNLFYFDLPRLSVDIDLNYIGNIHREQMLLEKPKLISTIEKICSDKKYKTLRQPSEHAGGKWVLSYKSKLIQQGQLEIDLNFISRVSLWKVTHLNSIQIGNYQANKIPVLDYYDLIGGKLSALFSRHKSRDLFDTYTIFTHSKKLDMEKMKCAFLIYGAASRTDIRKISLDHLNFDANELKNMLLPVLRNEEIKEAKNLKSWAKKLINICKENLSDIIAFNHNELDFLTNVIDHGKIIPELITKDKNIINAIHMHPVLLWKIINVKKYNNTRE